ncbi:thioredoxin-like domain-containing protein [Spirosoma flavum]|uniref:Thioredoxin-like domain-containing protein n=1 Tax=Spirosoma flavum TaxID=2048557 RepID=A0ABW6AU69_9BACT
MDLIKTHLTLLLIGLSLVSQGQNKGFVLIGRIVGDDVSQKATLYQRDIQRFDTTLISAKQFTFTGKVDHPYIATVGTNIARQGRGVWLSNDTIRASFKIDGGYLQPIEVSGPPETVDYLTNIDQINAIYTFTLSRAQKNQQVSDLISQYVLDHPTSSYSFFLVRMNTETLGASLSRDLVTKLSPALQESKDAQNLKKQLLNEEATALDKTLVGFSLPDTNGVLQRILPSGKPYTLLSFWASWCAPCRIHNRRDLVKLYQRLDHNQVELISISLDDDRAAWVSAIAKDGLTWPQRSDLNYLSGPTAKQLALYSVPQFILVDGSNKVLATNLDSAIRLIDKR